MTTEISQKNFIEDTLALYPIPQIYKRIIKKKYLKANS